MIKADNIISVQLNNSFQLQLFLLDEGEEFYLYHEIWDKANIRQPNIIPSGLMFYDVTIQKESYKDETVECYSNHHYKRGGKR